MNLAELKRKNWNEFEKEIERVLVVTFILVHIFAMYTNEAMWYNLAHIGDENLCF